MSTFELEAGTLLYHGTGSDELDETCQRLDRFTWLSTSPSVAKKFAQRFAEGNLRVITYKLTQNLVLPKICSQREMQAFVAEHDLSLDGVEEIRDTVDAAGLPGWVLPFNYPDGDDVLIRDTYLLDYVETTML